MYVTIYTDFWRNIGKYLPHYVASESKTKKSSVSEKHVVGIEMHSRQWIARVEEQRAIDCPENNTI
jgi:hypothetical protein